MDFRFAFKVIRMAIIGFWIIIFASAGIAVVDPVRAAGGDWGLGSDACADRICAVLS